MKVVTDACVPRGDVRSFHATAKVTRVSFDVNVAGDLHDATRIMSAVSLPKKVSALAIRRSAHIS